MSYRYLLLFFILALGSSCGTTTDEEIEDAIFHARQLLTGGRCQEAVSALAKIPPQPRNIDYLETAASAHACLGGYSTVNFFQNDLEKLGTAQTAFLGSLATFSTSNMITDADTSYQSLKTAITILLLGGGISSSSYTDRTAALGSRENSNLSVFALYMILVELGKYFNYYGNADDTTGIKGAGPQANGCYMNYTDAQAIAGIALQTGDNCDLTNEGHPALNLPAGRSRACEGIVFFNNFLDIISNVNFGGSNTGSLGDLTAISSVCVAGAVFNQEICDVKTFSECENDTTNITNIQIERFYGIILENMHL